MASTMCVVGLGSPQGDDQIGWLIADALDAQGIIDVFVRKAASPADLLNWIGEVEWLGICDACRGAGTVGDWFCWSWPGLAIDQHTFAGTHDVSLRAVLNLAATLGQAPPVIKIWGIEVGSCGPGEPVSMTLLSRIPQIVESIRHETNRHGGIDHA